MTSSKYTAPKALGKTLEDLRQHASTTFGAAALISLPVPFVAVYAAVRPTYLSTTAQTVINTMVAWWVAYAIILATKAYASDSDPGVSAIVGQSRSGLITYGLTRILLGLLLIVAAVCAVVVGGIILGVAAPGLLSGPPSIEAMAGLFLVMGPLVILALLFVYLLFGLAPVAAAIDRRRAGASLGRSREVTKGHRRDFLLLLFIVWVFTVIIQILVQGPAQMVAAQNMPIGNVDPQNLSFDALVEQAMQLPPPASPPQALVIAVSTYLSLLILEAFIAGFFARFYLGLTQPDEPTPGRDPDSDASGRASIDSGSSAGSGAGLPDQPPPG
ncbi:MAG: hypothetical protein WD602_09950 [Actinomycetota bacterium]